MKSPKVCLDSCKTLVSDMFSSDNDHSMKLRILSVSYSLLCTTVLILGLGVFEKTKERPGDKRKKARNRDPSDVDGYLGPWAKFKDEKTVMCPSEVLISFLLICISQGHQPAALQLSTQSGRCLPCSNECLRRFCIINIG